MNTLTVANVKSRSASRTLTAGTVARGRAVQANGSRVEKADAQERQVQEILSTFSDRWEW